MSSDDVGLTLHRIRLVNNLMGTESLPLTVTLLSNPLSLSLARESTSSGTECNGEALDLDISGTDASGDAKAETRRQ